MLDASGERVMITDFGFAKNFWESTPKTCLGTAAYVAPEVLELEPYDGTKVDAWACGVILYAMLEGNYPFGVGNGKGVGRKGDKELHKRLRRGWEAVDFPRHFQKGAVNLMKCLLTADPSERVSCLEALADEWFQTDPAVASTVASDLRKLRGQSPASAKKGSEDATFGAGDTPLKVSRLMTRQPPEPEPEPEPGLELELELELEPAEAPAVGSIAQEPEPALETTRVADAAAEVRPPTTQASLSCCSMVLAQLRHNFLLRFN
jgi:serine/threonine protein kinase